MVHLQGAAIPVHLSDQNLARGLRLAPRMHMVHAMFLAYGGDEAWRTTTCGTSRTFSGMLRRGAP